MVVCAHLPRFELVIAAGGGSQSARQALAGRALAIAPRPGGEARVGEVSGAAEAHGVRAGMALGEALARCPELGLVPADPLGVARAWERALQALEGIGAAVEPPRPGLAYFASDGLRGLHGGDDEGVIDAARAALGPRARLGAGPARLCALAAALEARSRRAVVVAARGGDVEAARRHLARRSIALLGFRAETAALVEPLARLGVRTLGELHELGRAALADRFGEAGRIAHALARGEDTPLRPRACEERLEETLELAEPGSGLALERVLELLVQRLLARRERRGRTLRGAVVSARLVEGGTWCERVVFRQPLADARRMVLALSLRLALLPSPARELTLSAERFGPPAGRQGTLLDDARALRLERLGEGVAQVRALAGPEAALRALCVDIDSRVPERRVVLAPWAAR